MSRLLSLAEQGRAFSARPDNELLDAHWPNSVAIVDPGAVDFGPVFQVLPGLRDLDALSPWRPVRPPESIEPLLHSLEDLLRRAGLPLDCLASRPREAQVVFRLIDLRPQTPEPSSDWPQRFVAVVVDSPWIEELMACPGLSADSRLLAVADRLAAEAGLSSQQARALRLTAAQWSLDRAGHPEQGGRT